MLSPAGCVCLALMASTFALPAFAADAGDAPVKNGRLGLRFKALDEGLLVTSVSPDLGAAAAGLVPGSLIVSVEGVAVSGHTENPRKLLVGPAGTSVSLDVLAPLAEAPSTVAVARSLPGASTGRQLPHRPAEVRAYRKSVRDKSRRRTVAAAQAMVDASFGGMAPREAVGGSLASLMRRGDRFAREVATVLATGAQDDAALLQGLARVMLETGAPIEAAALLDRRHEIVGADLMGGGFGAVDVGSSFQARALHIDALMQTGATADAEAKATELLRSHRDPGVARLVGLAAPAAQPEWRAKLPPVASFDVPLLDGTTWTSGDHLGEVVVVNFWATWCGPCKQELPELAELYERRKSDGVSVVAVSVDTGPKKAVEAMAADFKLPFDVGIDPELTKTFQVSAFPAIRLIGADGALHYSARGYSAAAMEKLDQAIDQAMEGAGNGGAPVATVWGPSAEGARLTRFFPVAGAAGVDASPDGIVVGVLGAPPVWLDADAAEPAEASVTASRGMPGQRVGWLDGAVATDPGGLLVRKFDVDGELEWLQRLPEPAADLVVQHDAVWVAARDHLYVFDADGALVSTVDVALTDLVRSPSGVAGVGPKVGFEGRIERVEGAAPTVEAAGTDSSDSAEVPATPPQVKWALSERDDDYFLTSADGDLAGGVVRQVVRARVGPDGAERLAVVRADNRLLVFGADGTPSVIAELRQAGDLVAVDFDGDGRDSLVVGIPDHGVAWIDLEVP